MLLKQYLTNWPPTVSIGQADVWSRATIPPKAGLDDTVSLVKALGPGNIELELRHSKYQQYTVTLSVPSTIQQKIIFEILRKRNITLHEVGELSIS